MITLTVMLQSCYFKSTESEQAKEFESTQRTRLNAGWEFKTKNADQWSTTDLPHTPRIEPLIVNDQWQGQLVYKKILDIEASHFTSTILHFEGVMHEASVMVNGTKVKEHVGGYLPFSVDMTDYLQKGQNEITIEVSNTNNSTIPPGKPLEGLDFNFYGGIYRDVWLVRKNDIHITDPFLINQKDAGWLIHFNQVTQKKASGEVRIQMKNGSKNDEDLTVNVELSDGKTVHFYEAQVRLRAFDTVSTHIPIEVDFPLLWSTTTPNLYDLSIEITSSNGVVFDRIEKKVGIRKIELANDGFYLNGEKQYIQGTNRHQEYPYVGYAISNNANYRDALKIKNAGFDFVRLSHYPQDESFLNACDELGLLVMNAIPGWQYYEEGAFVDNSYQDIRDMVRRDRNHPSVIFWEVSLNESGMTDDYMVEANRILREELPFDDTYSAGWVDHPAYDLFIPARQHASPPHYWNQYKNSQRPILVAEYGDWEYYAHNAGFNQMAFKNLSEEERNSRQLREHGEKRLLQQAFNFQEAANSNRRGKGTIGHANWLMFDYNRGYTDDLEASGISDIFRIPKFAYYFYRSQRPPSQTIQHPLVHQGPMVKIASYWTEESSTDVRVFSNCDALELYLNDSLVSRQKPVINEFSDHLPHPPFEFNLGGFEPGQLRAVGLINDRSVADDIVNSPGVPTAIRIVVDKVGTRYKETNDLVFVYAEVIDASGHNVPEYSSDVYFELNGPGELIGSNPVRAEAGIATILFRGDPEKIDVTATSADLVHSETSDDSN